MTADAKWLKALRVLRLQPGMFFIVSSWTTFSSCYRKEVLPSRQAVRRDGLEIWQCGGEVRYVGRRHDGPC